MGKTAKNVLELVIFLSVTKNYKCCMNTQRKYGIRGFNHRNLLTHTWKSYEGNDSIEINF